MTTKVFKHVSPALDRLGFRLRNREKNSADWIRDAHQVTRQEVGFQDSALDRDRVVGTLRISIRSTVWNAIQEREFEDDEFVDALTREWGANGIFYYGWQAWDSWRADDVEAITWALQEKAIPWLEFHSDPKNLIGVLEREVAEGYPAGPPAEPLQRKLFGRLLFGKNAPSPERLVIPLGHKERLGALYYGLGDLPNAARWLRKWLADRPHWTEQERYRRCIEELEAKAP